MAGGELVREAHRRRPGLPIRLTSGYEWAVLDESSVEEFELLRKPYSRQDLLATVRKALDGGKAA